MLIDYNVLDNETLALISRARTRLERIVLLAQYGAVYHEKVGEYEATIYLIVARHGVKYYAYLFDDETFRIVRRILRKGKCVRIFKLRMKTDIIKIHKIMNYGDKIVLVTGIDSLYISAMNNYVSYYMNLLIIDVNRVPPALSAGTVSYEIIARVALDCENRECSSEEILNKLVALAVESAEKRAKAENTASYNIVSPASEREVENLRRAVRELADAGLIKNYDDIVYSDYFWLRTFLVDVFNELLRDELDLYEGPTYSVSEIIVEGIETGLFSVEKYREHAYAVARVIEVIDETLEVKDYIRDVAKVLPVLEGSVRRAGAR